MRPTNSCKSSILRGEGAILLLCYENRKDCFAMNSVLNNTSLRERLIREGLLEMEACTPEENERFQDMLEASDALPKEVFRTDESAYEFQRVAGSMPTPEEERNLMMALQTKDIKAIRSWLAFGVVSLFIILIFVLSLLAD